MDHERMINNMDALLFALSLEVVLQHLQILEGSTELRVQCWKMTDKIARLQRDKLARDREIVKDTMRLTLIELIKKCEFSTLQKAVAQLAHKAMSAVSKRQQHEQLRTSLKNLFEEIETKRQQWSIDLRNADYKMAMLRDKINDDQLNANLRLAYAEKWILARVESLGMQFDKPRVPPPRVDHEERVHKELLKAYALQIQERERSLEHWQERFTVDTADITKRLSVKCEELRVATAQRMELQKIYDLHEGEMRAWLTFKSERAARIAREEKLRISATRIQSWWRGVMVRRALGVFKYLRNIKKTPAKSKKK